MQTQPLILFFTRPFLTTAFYLLMTIGPNIAVSLIAFSFAIQLSPFFGVKEYFKNQAKLFILQKGEPFKEVADIIGEVGIERLLQVILMIMMTFISLFDATFLYFLVQFASVS